jgi:NAD-dependent glycerol-3-phosphate dehydrogenase N-terminus
MSAASSVKFVWLSKKRGSKKCCPSRQPFQLFGPIIVLALLFGVQGKQPLRDNIIEKSLLAESADVIMRNPQDAPPTRRDKVCIIGSGNWGSAIACLVGRNCAQHEENMWVYEETIETPLGPQKLADIINSQHENVKYLPGVQLPKNVLAVAELKEACRDATLLVFVLPHQFLPQLLPVIRSHAHSSCRGVSLIKGLGTQKLED